MVKRLNHLLPLPLYSTAVIVLVFQPEKANTLLRPLHLLQHNISTQIQSSSVAMPQTLIFLAQILIAEICLL